VYTNQHFFNGVTYYGKFTMTDGTISGNTASDSGGGVYDSGGGPFTKSGGTIYGSNETNTALKNTATTGYGHAVLTNVSSMKG
jgi:hypothetical protein